MNIMDILQRSIHIKTSSNIRHTQTYRQMFEEESQEEEAQLQQSRKLENNYAEQAVSPDQPFKIVFPIEDIRAMKFKDKTEIRACLNQNDDFFYRIVDCFERTLIRTACNIDGCKAFVHFLWDVQKYIYHVTQIENRHSHSHEWTDIQKQTRGEYQKSSLKGIKLQRDLKLERDLKLQYTTNLPKTNYKRLSVTCGAEGNLIRQRYRLLSEYNTQTWEYPTISQGQFPSIILFWNQRMKEQYLKYGDCVKFDESELNILINKNEFVKRRLILFTGFNQHNTIVVFAGALIGCYNQELYYRLFCAFLDVFGDSPETFITPWNEFIRTAMTKLKKERNLQFHRFSDTKTFVKCAKSGMIKARNTALLIDRSDLAMKILDSKTAAQFETVLEKYDKIKELHLTDTMRSFKGELCTTFAPKKFHGLDTNILGRILLNYEISKKVTRSSTFLYIAIHTLDFMKRKQAQQKIFIIPSEEISHYNDHFLEQVRIRLNKNLFEVFLETYKKALNLPLKKICENEYRFREQILVVHCQCSCGQKERTGLPCSHLLRVLKEEEHSYLAWIKERWLLDPWLTAKEQEHDQYQDLTD